MSKQFNNKWIVITRPVHQAGALSQRLERAGAQVIPFPLLEIVAPKDPLLIQQQLHDLSDVDTAIFISPNAVVNAFNFVTKAQLAPLNIAAVGKKTALTLKDHGLRVDYFPDKYFNSEALLALDAMKQVQGQHIIIFRGEGGRDALRDGLVQRGAQVTYHNVYARRCPVDNIEVLKQYYRQQKLDIIVLTSGESLRHLLRLAKDEQWIADVPLLVGSQRIKQMFQQQFAGEFWVAPDPSDETMYNYLDSYL